LSVVKESITRRAVMAMLPGCLVAAQNRGKKAKPLPSVGEFVRFPDPTTENVVVRLTAPTSNSMLPAAPNRFVSVKERYLVFSSDRQGQLMPYQVDLRTGALRKIVDTTNLDPSSLSLIEKSQLLYFRDGGTLIEANLASKKTRTIETEVEAFGVDETGAGLFIVRKGKLEQVNGGDPAPVADNVAPRCLVRPGGQGCLFERPTPSNDREFWYAPASAAGAAPVLLAKGRVSNPVWSRTGETVLFLRDVPAGDGFLSEIHEVHLENGAEDCVSPTSQFAAFAPNEDGSVFVGASRSKAQPTIVLLLRSVRREMTLCEHRASHPAAVAPAFSADSRRVYFQSDHGGKFAIYSVNVERLVEPTDSGAA